ADFGTELGNLAAQRFDIFLDGRVGMVIGETAIGLTVERGDIEAKASQDGHAVDAAHAVAGIDDDLEAPLPGPQILDERLLIGRMDVDFTNRSLPLFEVGRFDERTQRLNFVAMKRAFSTQDLEPVVFRRIVAARNLDAPVDVEVENGEI